MISFLTFALIPSGDQDEFFRFWSSSEKVFYISISKLW